MRPIERARAQEEDTMERTTDKLMVFVSDEKIPIELTEAAVEELQAEAAGKAQFAVDEIVNMALTRSGSLAGLEQWRLSELREYVSQLGRALDVLWYCRPEEYEDGSESEAA